MFTTFDKALAALLGSVGSLLAMWGLNVSLLQDPTIVTSVVGVVTALVTYFVPNKVTVAQVNTSST